MMRTRIGWLALLLTAGLALAPTAVRGQTIPYEVPTNQDWVFPIPTYSPRPELGGFYTFGEFLYWRQTNPMGHQVVAYRGLQDTDGTITGNAGTLLGSFNSALDAHQVSGPNSYIPGYRLGVGYRFRDGMTAEFSYAHLFNVRLIAGATLLPPTFPAPGLLTNQLANTFLFSPVFNFPVDWFGVTFPKVAAGVNRGAIGIWNAASEMHLHFDQRLDRFEFKFRIPIWETEYDPMNNPNKLALRTYGLAGLRHTWIWERFFWRTVSRDVNGNATLADVADYANILSQPMYGPFVGWGGEIYEGHGTALSLDLTGTAYLNFVREYIRWERGDKGTQAKRSRRVYTISPELEAMLNFWWYPIEGVQIRVGYDVMAIFNTIASPQPVDFDFGAIAPDFPHKNLRLIDGWNLGICFIF